MTTFNIVASKLSIHYLLRLIHIIFYCNILKELREAVLKICVQIQKIFE